MHLVVAMVLLWGGFDSRVAIFNRRFQGHGLCFKREFRTPLGRVGNPAAGKIPAPLPSNIRGVLVFGKSPRLTHQLTHDVCVENDARHGAGSALA